VNVDESHVANQLSPVVDFEDRLSCGFQVDESAVNNCVYICSVDEWAGNTDCVVEC
jgi:hypothetical protein